MCDSAERNRPRTLSMAINTPPDRCRRMATTAHLHRPTAMAAMAAMTAMTAMAAMEEMEEAGGNDGNGGTGGNRGKKQRVSFRHCRHDDAMRVADRSALQCGRGGRWGLAFDVPGARSSTGPMSIVQSAIRATQRNSTADRSFLATGPTSPRQLMCRAPSRHGHGTGDRSNCNAAKELAIAYCGALASARCGDCFDLLTVAGISCCPAGTGRVFWCTKMMQSLPSQWKNRHRRQSFHDGCRVASHVHINISITDFVCIFDLARRLHYLALLSLAP